MVVYKDASPYSEMQFGEKAGIWMTNLRADVQGPGDFKVYIHTHLEKESWMEKVTLNVYAQEEVQMTEISQSDPHGLFLSAQNLCPEIETQHGTFQTRKTFASNGLPYYENVDKYSQLRYIFFSPVRVLNIPGQDGSVRPVGSNQWNIIDDLNKAVQDPNIAFIGLGNLGSATNKVKNGGCRALPSQHIHHRAMYSAPQSAEQPSTYFAGHFDQGDGCNDGVVKPYMAQTYKPLQQYTLDQCRKLLTKFEDGSLNNLQDIKSSGTDLHFPADQTSIAEPGTDCGDAARGITKPCSDYDHWSSIMGMFGRVGASSSMPVAPSTPALPYLQPSQPSNFPSCFRATGSPNSCTVSNKCHAKFKLRCVTASGSMSVTFPIFEYTYVNQNVPWCNGCRFEGFTPL